MKKFLASLSLAICFCAPAFAGVIYPGYTCNSATGLCCDPNSTICCDPNTGQCSNPSTLSTVVLTTVAVIAALP